MRILHTSDWHIGKKVNEISMIEDQKYIFNQLYEIIEREKVDVVIIAGDIYDTSIVSTEAVNLLDEVLGNIVNKCKKKVIIISGNHDSADRLSFGRNLLRGSGVYIEGRFKGNINKIVLEDEFGEINFYPLSYFNEEDVKLSYDGCKVSTPNEGFKVIMDNTYVDYSKRNIFIAHGYFSNKDMDRMIESESERKLSIGGQEVIDVSILEKFDYVALGHLHANQKVIHDHIRYSGSILKYSFSEMNHKKSITLIDVLEKGNIEISTIPLKLRHDMKEIEGYIDTLTDREFYKDLNLEDYYRIILHDSVGVPDPATRLRKVYKNFMEIKFKDLELEGYGLKDIEATDIVSKSPIDLFMGFYSSVTSKDITDEQIGILKDVVSEMLEEEDV